jgi:TolB protein
MSLDGSEKQNITQKKGVEWTYYSFKDKLYFISDQDTCQRCAYFLYETNFKGERPKKISEIPLADSWMSSRKNGREFIVKPKKDSTFYIIDAHGNLINKVVTGFPYSGDPLFVNDGKQIVFRGGLTASKLIDGFNEALYIMDENGLNTRKLTHYPEQDTSAGKFAYKAGTPKLHPTENFISYQSKQNGKYSLYAVTLDGEKNWKLTNNAENEGWHAWSPDGRWLAIELFDDAQTQFHVGLMNWKSKEMKVLTGTEYRYQQAPNFVLKN